MAKDPAVKAEHMAPLAAPGYLAQKENDAADYMQPSTAPHHAPIGAKRPREQIAAGLGKHAAVVSLLPQLYIDCGLLGAVIEQTRALHDRFCAVVWDRAQLHVSEGFAQEGDAAQAGERMLYMIAEAQRPPPQPRSGYRQPAADSPPHANARLRIAPAKLALPHLNKMQEFSDIGPAPGDFPYYDQFESDSPNIYAYGGYAGMPGTYDADGMGADETKQQYLGDPTALCGDPWA